VRHDPSHSQPDGHSAHRAQHEGEARIEEREGAGGHGGEGEAVGDERGAVVDEGLALHHGHDPPRDAEPSGDGGRGHRIGGRDDGPEHERGRPRHAVDQEVRGRGDRDRGDQDEAHASSDIGGRLSRRSRREEKNAAE